MEDEIPPASIDSLVEELQDINLSTSTPQNNHENTPDLTIPDDVNVCDTPESLSAAIVELRTYDTLILDCEGEELGTRGGALSLISIRGVYSPTSDPPKTFLFDLICLDEPPSPLLELLSSPAIRKVVYDGRMDFCAIWFGYGVALKNIVDLQVAAVKRRMRTESLETRLGHLGAFFSPKAIQSPRRGRSMCIYTH